MNQVIPVTDDIYYVGVDDYETHLFESIWPLPRGVSYNSYVIADEKVAIIDAVKRTYFDVLLDRARRAADGRGVDYLVINHMEPDHSGAVRAMCEVYPEMKLIGNAKTADYVQRFYGLGDRMQVVKDGETLSLGKHTLSFHLTPMVHWPETMMTYDQTDKVLFAGDAFGGFGALPHGIFDDEVDLDYYEDEILRYFSNIVGKYAPMVVKAVEKLKDVPVEIVASTHGPVWRTNPGEIIDKYIRWSKHETEPGVVIAYASMYGNTQHMAQIIARRLAERGVRKVRVHDVSRTDVSYLIRDIWRYKVLAIGSPTYNQRVFPLMADLLGHLENKNMRDRALAIFGTYTWSGGGVKGMKEFADRTKWELIEPVIEAQCSAAQDDMRQCIELGDRIADVVEQAHN